MSSDRSGQGISAHVTALVPMKERSIRVPGKNMRTAGGRPLFRHIVDTLLGCETISRIAVDTDSKSIAGVLRAEYPGVVIIDRPPALAGPDVPMNAVLAHDLSLLDGELFLQTHATNPLLRASTIDAAVRTFLERTSHDSLFSVTRVRKRFWDVAGAPVNHDPAVLVNTQDLPPLFEENSCIYLFSRTAFMLSGNRMGAKPLMYEIDKDEAVDIDDEADFALVDRLLSTGKS